MLVLNRVKTKRKIIEDLPKDCGTELERVVPILRSFEPVEEEPGRVRMGNVFGNLMDCKKIKIIY